MLDVPLSEHRATGCEKLRPPVRDKVVFAMTSNEDALFVRHGFDGSKIFTPQGDFARMHCHTMGADVCRVATWPSRPILERIVAATVPATGEVIDPEVSPACPHCLGEVFLNVRECADFVFGPHVEQAERLNAWLWQGAAASTIATLLKDAQVIR